MIVSSLLRSSISIAFFAAVSFTASAQVNLSNGLVAYYPFNGNFNDASGNGNNGTPMNGITFGNDPWSNANSAASFDGIDDYVNIAASSSLLAKKNFSLAFRFKTNSSQVQVPISKANYFASGSQLDNVQYQIAFNVGSLFGTDGLFLNTNHSGIGCVANGNSSHRTFGAAPVLNTWHCAVLTFDSGTKKIFIDGVLTGQSTVTGFSNNSTPDSCFGGPLKLGVWWQNDPRWFSGVMDELRVYSRTLNTQEVDSMCKLTSTSIAQNTRFAEQVTLSPVPATESIAIEGPGESFPLSYKFLNSVGQAVLQGTISSAAERIRVNQVAAGIYSIMLTNRGGQQGVLRFLKQ
ncbi:MAG TPA: LamG domain-containing protein [Fibrella sp.]